eukprot:333513-Amphidinium_carterae.1
MIRRGVAPLLPTATLGALRTSSPSQQSVWKARLGIPLKVASSPNEGLAHPPVGLSWSQGNFRASDARRLTM